MLRVCEDPKLCLIGFCGRLCYQKGIHLIMDLGADMDLAMNVE